MKRFELHSLKDLQPIDTKVTFHTQPSKTVQLPVHQSCEQYVIIRIHGDSHPSSTSIPIASLYAVPEITPKLSYIRSS